MNYNIRNYNCTHQNSKNDPRVCAFLNKQNMYLETLFNALDASEIYPYMADIKNDIWYVSDALKNLLGEPDNIIEHLGSKWENIIYSKRELDLYLNDMKMQFNPKLSQKGIVHDLVYRVKDQNSKELWIRGFGTVQWDEDGKTPLYFCGHVSILKHILEIDPVTSFFREESALKEIATILHNSQNVRYLCFRLNNFHYINEILRKDKANVLISEIVNELLDTFRNIKFFRLEGLRILAIIPTKDEDFAHSVGEKIQEIVLRKYESFDIFMSEPCSVGIINDCEEKISAREVMRYIMNMFELIKQDSSNHLDYTSHDIESYRNTKMKFLSLAHDVHDTLDNFRVVIQPIISAETYDIVGGEILLRWKYKDKDISPLVFIPELERGNLISTVGKWVFIETVKVLKHARQVNPKFFLDFNVSYYQINDKSFCSLIKDVTTKEDIAKYIIMELTETHYNDNPKQFEKFVTHCQESGIRLALDDFGTGYSTFEVLFDYPAEIIKLDKSILNRISDIEENKQFISTIISACHQLGKKVCAEGIETESQLNMIKKAGANYMQGFYFYKPMEIEDFYDLIR